MSNETNQPKEEEEIQQKIQSLIDLVTNRSQGQINDDLLENAVSSLLSNANVVDTGGTIVANASLKHGEKEDQKKKNVVKQQQQQQQHHHQEEENAIVEDEENYDDDDGDDESVTNNKSNNNDSDTNSKKDTKEQKYQEEPKWTGPKVSIESLQEQEKKLLKQKRKAGSSGKNNKNKYKIDFSETWDKLDSIPLGRIGARMMVTFGDNIDTVPEACATALMGTRQCLQSAIKDARALRRKLKEDYNRAKVIANLHKAKKKERSILKEGSDAPVSDNVDLEMLFKAISGYDKIGYEPKCGFDDTQLEKLFPEEINAYKRWKNAHEAYTESKSEGDKVKISTASSPKKDGNDSDEDADADENDDNVDHDEKGQEDNIPEAESKHIPKKDEELIWGGHLSDRLHQFDTRTERMKEDWYMAFSVVRQGSFLPRSVSTEDRQWEKARKGRGRGKRQVHWENLPASYVQFLHWVGFDHRSALPPPNEETTEALSFLGYDFMGKIIEKAIFLRCLKNREQKRSNDGDKNKRVIDDEKMILELELGEQLTKEDIERALGDSTIGGKALYNAAHSVLDNASVQLYFGPGFEERIEMELDQMLMSQKSKCQLSGEEKEIRQKEDELFEQLKAPPKKLEGVLDILGGDQESHVEEQRINHKKRLRKKDEKQLNAFEIASQKENDNGDTVDDSNVLKKKARVASSSN